MLIPKEAKDTDWFYPLVNGYKSKNTTAEELKDCARKYMEEAYGGDMRSIVKSNWENAMGSTGGGFIHAFADMRRALLGMRIGFDRKPIQKLIRAAKGGSELAVAREAAHLERRIWNEVETEVVNEIQRK
jgi:hypothetical protein